MSADFGWTEGLALDVRYGYLGNDISAPRQHNPQVVLNTESGTVLRALREELARADSFLFSVAFVAPRAIALLKQELVDFSGDGTIVTSDYLGFNSPAAFVELKNLTQLGVDVRIHRAAGFHPKGYLFNRARAVTAMVGSSNLTPSALALNHEWNLKVTAAASSDLAAQFARLSEEQLAQSVPLTDDWIADYAARYVAPPPRVRRPVEGSDGVIPVDVEIEPNRMQEVALAAIADVRAAGEKRALVISATGTGKTILSALDVRAVNPARLLFVVHREQILDRTIEEYRRVLGGPASDYGKLTGSSKQADRRYVFATVQTLSQPEVLGQLSPTAFDYVVVDEAHRSAANTHQSIIDHFTPAFMLGMTATPERTDGQNVFEIYEHNVPYEIRLNRALEEDMLCPFHYYGVADVTLENGETVDGDDDLKVLISPERVDHLLNALEVYGQAAVPPRGLIFCSRVDEAHELSERLNDRRLRGRRLRTVALSGRDAVAEREQAVRRLEAGELDYILTVDIFNEGVDIPSINQIVMLRQTQSAIVFVQQLGRGLRKADGKDYVVVIDFIGNYANNFLIPIALFGDESLNKESLRQHLIAAEEAGVLPGLSSVRFDKISQERVLRSITQTTLDSMQNLKKSIVAMRNRLGKVPALADFLRFESTDPVLLATKGRHYPDLIERVLKIGPGLTHSESRDLAFLSREVLPAKRGHEFVLLRHLLKAGGSTTRLELAAALVASGLPASDRHLRGVIESFTLANHAEKDVNKYSPALLEIRGDALSLRADALTSYQDSQQFRAAVDDIIETGTRMVAERYRPDLPFTVGRQYCRKEVARLLCWPRKWESTIYGYKTDESRSACPLFVTLHKSDDVAASTAYEDALLDSTHMQWFTKSNRTLQSKLEGAIVANEVPLYVFVKKDDAEGSDFYYLGRPTVEHAEDTTMVGDGGKRLPVVRTILRFEDAIESALFDYFHPEITA